MNRLHASSPTALEMVRALQDTFAAMTTKAGSSDEYGKKGTKNIIQPSSLFRVVSTKNELFRGNRQQDSHELLRFLLDVAVVEIQDAVRSKKKLAAHAIIGLFSIERLTYFPFFFLFCFHTALFFLGSFPRSLVAGRCSQVAQDHYFQIDYFF
jgi:hypothetical protein